MTDRIGSRSPPLCRRFAIAQRGPSAQVRPSTPSEQVLLGDGAAEPVVGGNEFLDELVQSVPEDLVHAAVLDLRASGASLTLGRALTTIGARDVVEVLHQIAITGCERSRQLVLENKQLGDQPGFHALEINPMVGGERRDRAQDRRPLEVIKWTADALV